MNKVILGVLICFFSLPSVAQSTDLARVEYTYFPQSNSDNSFRRFRTFINYPIKLNDKGAYLLPGVEYRNVNFIYQDSENFSTLDLDRFQSFTGKLGYTFKLSETWRFGAEAGLMLASNFSTGEIMNDDFIYTGALYFMKSKDGEEVAKPWRLILGLSYSTTRGFPFPLPVVNYYQKLNEKWSYMVGIPKANLKYAFNDRNSIQSFVTLDGFFANIQENFSATPLHQSQSNAVDSMSMTVVLGGLGYEYKFTEHLSIYLYGGYTLINDIRLRDDNLDDVYTINDANTFYTRGGLKFNIL